MTTTNHGASLPSGTPEWHRVDRPWSEYPMGTEARDHNGCIWTKEPGGWHALHGDTFPTPAASATLVRPSASPPSPTTPAPKYCPMALLAMSPHAFNDAGVCDRCGTLWPRPAAPLGGEPDWRAAVNEAFVALTAGDASEARRVLDAALAGTERPESLELAVDRSRSSTKSVAVAEENVFRGAPETAPLTDTLKFYADQMNYMSPSTGFALQYDPEPSPISKDSGQRARAVLAAHPADAPGGETEQRARLAALTEVHEFYEFDATTEEQFDTWLHEQIKAVRVKLGLAASLTEVKDG